MTRANPLLQQSLVFSERFYINALLFFNREVSCKDCEKLFFAIFASRWRLLTATSSWLQEFSDMLSYMKSLRIAWLSGRPDFLKTEKPQVRSQRQFLTNWPYSLTNLAVAA